MALAKSFEELEVYRMARREAQAVFEMTRSFPREETYALTDQVRRSSRAVGAMVAEAWGRRRYPAVFASKLSEAVGESLETQAWLDHALDCGYLSAEQHGRSRSSWQHVAAMLYRMMQRTDDFCRHTAKR
jgi:four helix bundle protein